MKAINFNDKTVAVIGLGYVGLPLLIESSKHFEKCVGLDLDSALIEQLNINKVELFNGSYDNKNILNFENTELTTDWSKIKNCDFKIVCVPTPITKDLPDMSYVENACKNVGMHLNKNDVVIMESTYWPGATEEFVKPLLEMESGLIAGIDFFLGYSPERIDPGNPNFNLRNTPKIVSGLNEDSTRIITQFYDLFVDKVVKAETMKAAETAKLLENTYRFVNISFINEFAQVCKKLEVDVWETINLASTKPFGFNAFFPGIGAGGHCIPVDPIYLSYKFRNQTGKSIKFIDLAQELNNETINYVQHRIEEIFSKRNINLKESSICLVGVSYKDNSRDTRESPTIKLYEKLEKKCNKLIMYDPLVKFVKVNGILTNVKNEIDDEILNSDLIVIIRTHAEINLSTIIKNNNLILDTKNFIKNRLNNIEKM